jgi:hypothetical protein
MPALSDELVAGCVADSSRLELQGRDEIARFPLNFAAVRETGAEPRSKTAGMNSRARGTRSARSRVV